MSDTIGTEVARLKAILAFVERPFKPNVGATADQIHAVERQVGITFDDDLRAFFEFANGSRAECFAVLTDELTACAATPLADAVKAWDWPSWYDESNGLETHVGRPRDPRIQPRLLHHRAWFPIAEFNGFSTAVYFDADPASAGRYGQIIAYQHDPDAIYYVAESFADFLRRSNDLLSANLTQLLFMEDEYERICHMSGTAELERQLAGGLDITESNGEGCDLRAKARYAKRLDLISYLDDYDL